MVGAVFEMNGHEMKDKGAMGSTTPTFDFLLFIPHPLWMFEFWSTEVKHILFLTAAPQQKVEITEQRTIYKNWCMYNTCIQ